jgi:hypothetical protein
MNNQVECPVDFVAVNENKVRLTSFFVLLLGVLFIVTEHWSIAAFLMIDFYLRGFHHGKWSLLNWISSWFEKKLSFSNKPIDRAPKRFAAQLGFLFTDLILIASFLELKETALYLDITLVAFAFLESIFGICVGCHIYSLLKKLSTDKEEQELFAGAD